MSQIGKILLFVGIVFMVLWFVSMRALSGSLMPFVWVVLGVGVLCILAAVIKDIQFFMDLAGQRTTKHGLNMGALVFIVTAILVGVNFVGYRHVKKFDYTKEKLHSLADQSKKVLNSLDSDLEVRAFFVDNQQQGAALEGRFKDIAGLYSTASSKVKITYINPVKRPYLAKKYDITSQGTVSLEYKGRKAKFDDMTEQGFTNAIIKITRDKNKVIYYVTGHGEHDFNGSDPTDMQAFKKYLSDSSYDVKPLSFAETQKVPDDAAVLVIAGPKTAYFPPEIQAVKDYLYRGGKLFLALDPGTKNNLGSLAHDIGVDFKDNYILDQLGQLVGGGGATAVGIGYSSSSEITKGFRQNMTVFQLASQVGPAKDKPDGIAVEDIVKSSPMSFSKKEIQTGEIKFDPKTDEKGPLAIVDTSTGTLKQEPGHGAPQEFTAVVAGNSQFLTNQLIDAQLNHDLALNAVAYLAKDKELVSIRPREAESSTIAITQVQQTILFYFLVAILPLSVFLTGGVFWYRRRTV